MVQVEFFDGPHSVGAIDATTMPLSVSWITKTYSKTMPNNNCHIKAVSIGVKHDHRPSLMDVGAVIPAVCMRG
ncbi:MAG TPA: hypothetical protein PKZ32_02990 [Candidatus Melainabacteria bacterium]|nr:hypothetical protein [Candidatus Melainabacteria bacterium]